MSKNEAIERLKRTVFYTTFVHKLFLSETEPTSIFFEADIFTKDNLNDCYDELGSDFQYILRDITYAETDIVLKEVK